MNPQVSQKRHFKDNNDQPLCLSETIQSYKVDEKKHFKDDKDEPFCLCETVQSYDVDEKKHFKDNNQQFQKTQSAQTSKEEKSFEIKLPKNTKDYDPLQMAIRRKCIDAIVNVFKKHGGVQIDTPVFEVKHLTTDNYVEDTKLTYDFKDKGGENCALIHDLPVPVSRFMAMNKNIAKIKMFHIGKVYQKDQSIMKNGYKQFYQCDFDITGNYDPMLPDAQVLFIMQEVFQALEINQFIVKVNNRKLLECILQQAQIPIERFTFICHSIDKLKISSWQKVKQDLISKGITQQQAKIIGQISNIKGSPFQVLDNIRKNCVFIKSKDKISKVLEQMSQLLKYLKAFHSLDRITFDLSLTRGLDYYTGIIFQIVLTRQQNNLEVISGGGRYDNLIGMFSSHENPAVGGYINIQRLFTFIEQRYQKKLKPNACQVLVATIGNIPIQQKLQIVSELWRMNIKAETLYQQNQLPQEQVKYAFENGIPMMLWIGQNQLKSGWFKLKILYKKEQVTLYSKDLQKQLMPYIESFRKDFQLGKIKLLDSEYQTKNIK